jgi:hypothetical protein
MILRDAAFDGGETTLWVNSDRTTMSAQCPLLTQQRPNRCATIKDATGDVQTFVARAVAL